MFFSFFCVVCLNKGWIMKSINSDLWVFWNFSDFRHHNPWRKNIGKNSPGRKQTHLVAMGNGTNQAAMMVIDGRGALPRSRTARSLWWGDANCSPATLEGFGDETLGFRHGSIRASRIHEDIFEHIWDILLGWIFGEGSGLTSYYFMRNQTGKGPATNVHLSVPAQGRRIRGLPASPQQC